MQEMNEIKNNRNNQSIKLISNIYNFPFGIDYC
jgi:hypothetical protein